MKSYSSRTHFTSLPSLEELKKIMQIEQYRAVPKYKEHIHYADFQAAIALFQTLDLPTEYFTQDWHWDDFEKNDLIDQINDIGKNFLAKILATHSSKTVFDQAYEYLAQEDIPKKADLIFVFGAKTPARIEKAIDLYHQGLAPKIMLSGGSPFYERQKISEAEKYRAIAINGGVKSEDIIVETQSITLPDNVRTSLNQLEKIGLPLNNLIIVNSPYCQRRGYGVFKKYSSKEIAIYRVNCDTALTYSHDHWYKHPEGIKVVFNEWVKLKLSAILNTV